MDRRLRGQPGCQGYLTNSCKLTERQVQSLPQRPICASPGPSISHLLLMACSLTLL